MKSATRIGIYGAAGRMGRRLTACAQNIPEIDVVATIDREQRSGDFSMCDVVVDVSVADATGGLIDALHGCTAALVTGVTGRNAEQTASIHDEISRRAVFIAANFSVGIAVLNRLVAEAAKALGETYDIEVLELHHRKKADAPSGTALQLAETAADSAGLPWPEARRVRDGMTGPRQRSELGTAALRGGTVAGEHTVYFFGDSERIELTHRATDRDVFAHGALRAARWVSGQKPGLYGMSDLLG